LLAAKANLASITFVATLTARPFKTSLALLASLDRSFRSSVRERSHQPSYEWMLAMAVLLPVGVFGIAFA
jgi:hypothetical protein